MAWRAKRQVAAKTSRHGVPESFVLTAKQFQVCTKVTKDAKSSMALEAAPLHTQMFRIWTSSVPSGCSLTVRIIAVLSGFANVQFLWVSWLQTSGGEWEMKWSRTPVAPTLRFGLDEATCGLKGCRGSLVWIPKGTDGMNAVKSGTKSRVVKHVPGSPQTYKQVTFGNQAWQWENPHI